MSKFDPQYDSPRHLAVKFNLAQFTRGRMGKPAMALIKEARDSGVKFASETPGLEPDAPKVVEPVVIPDSLRDGVHYARKPSSKKYREPTKYTGVTEEGYKVAWESCSRCTQFSAYCGCPAGPRGPSIVVKTTSTEPIDIRLD
jgi:hypothetical protein